MTPSAAGFVQFRLARAAALLAVLVLGVQDGPQGPPAFALPPPVSDPAHTTVAAQDLTPAYTILPVAPAEVAKPSPPQRRPSISAPTGATAVAQELTAPSTPVRGRASAETRRPSPTLCPPYAARAPPLFS